MHNELKRIVDLLESHLGDSDGYLPDDLSQEELEDEFPVEAALQIAVKLMIETENAAPPAQPTLTDDARLSKLFEVLMQQNIVTSEESYLSLKCIGVPPNEAEFVAAVNRALTAAQSASGDAK